MSICSIDGCEKHARRRGWCGMHHQRWLRYGSVDVVHPNNPAGEANPYWKGDNVTYGGAHRRVYRTRGMASGHKCSCGGAASQWAYDRLDPNEKTELSPGGPRRYSPDPDHYVPMCTPCHKRFDLDYIKENIA